MEPVRPAADPVSGTLHPVLTVVIPAHGREDLVANAAASVRRSLAWNCAEVVVVDDASPTPIALPLHLGARIVRLDENVGFGQACDAGARSAIGAFLLFLNSDAELRPGAVEEMLEYAHRGYGVVGCLLTWPRSHQPVQHGGIEWSDAAGSYVHVGRNQDLPGPPTREVEAVSGACLLVRRRTFEALGGFGGAYGRGYFEDVDLCLRARAAGLAVAYVAEARADHWEHQSFGEGRPDGAQLRAAHEVFKGRWGAARPDVPAAPTRPTVAVVVTAYGAPDRVDECLAACARHRGDLPHLDVDWLVVDDCTPVPDAAAVADSAARHGFRLLRLPENVGYKRAAAAGVAATTADWVVLLNSDVVVTRGWLQKMVRAGESDGRVAVVTPLSNAAVNLSVAIPRGRDLDGAARSAVAASLGEPLDVVYPVGFCLAVRRKAWDALSGFDPWPRDAYGEETDLCERALQAGWRCVMEPSAYVWHEGHASHGQAAAALEKDAVTTFLARHGAVAQARMVAFQRSRTVERVRGGVDAARPHDPRPAVTFYVPEAALCGGVLACYHLARRLSATHGWRAVVATRNLLNHADMEAAGRLYPLHYRDNEEFVRDFADDRDGPRGGVLVATAWQTAEMVAKAAAASRGRVATAYFVQDDEATFTLPNGRLQSDPARVAASYPTIPAIVSNSLWVRDRLAELGHGSEMIPVGVDHRLFRPRRKEERFTVLAMARQFTPRRGYHVLRDAFAEIRARAPEVRLVVYGQRPESSDGILMEWAGQLPQHRLADLMGRCHVLVDASDSQGFGLPALEAMASGCVPVVRANRGIDTYGEHDRDCLVAEAHRIADAVLSLRDPDRWVRMAAAGRETALRFTWDLAAERWDRWLRATFPAVARAGGDG